MKSSYKCNFLNQNHQKCDVYEYRGYEYVVSSSFSKSIREQHKNKMHEIDVRIDNAFMTEMPDLSTNSVDTLEKWFKDRGLLC